MNSKLYKLALWYIKKCNAKCENRYKEKVESLARLTYWAFDKYLLLLHSPFPCAIMPSGQPLNTYIEYVSTIGKDNRSMARVLGRE